jgi:hypothetical protein
MLLGAPGKIVRRPVRTSVCAAVVTVGLAGFAGTAAAKATVGTFYSQDTISFVEPPSSCNGMTGMGTNTITDSGQFVDNGQTFTFHGLESQTYRIDYPDGSYLTSTTPDHFEGVSTARGQFVFTEAQQDRGTLYAAAGTVIGTVSVFTLTHTSWRDVNGNGQPDPGEFTATVDQFRVTCP